MGSMLPLSDRNVSKLKQVAPVITGQQSVDAVVLRVTAEQNQLRSAAWDEQPRAFSLRSLRKSSSRGSPPSATRCCGKARGARSVGLRVEKLRPSRLRSLSRLLVAQA